MIGIKVIGDWGPTKRFLRYVAGDEMFSELERYGRQGVDALRQATPQETGETAASWNYKITFHNKKYHVEWYNTHEVDGVKIAVILQYGHATRGGGFIEGIDYINPALRPIFENLANNVWKKVTDA